MYRCLILMLLWQNLLYELNSYGNFTFAASPIRFTTELIQNQESTKISASLGELRNQLPENLLNTLNKKHPNWKLPLLPSEYIAKSSKQKQGPYFICGDFNGDQVKDYAVQIQEKETVKILAYVSQGKSFQEYKLTEAQAIKNGKRSESIFYLCISPKNSEIYNYRTEKNLKLAQDAVYVGASKSASAYFFKNGAFKEILCGN